MDRDLRASLVTAGAASALSALVGIVAGVGFLTIVIRALAAGFVIGAAVYGGIELLKRVLPGILDSVNPPSGEAGPESLSVPGMGNNVDIVLPGEEVETFSSNPEAGATKRASAASRRDPEPLVGELEPETAKSGEDAAEEQPYDDEPSLLEPEEAAFEAEAAIPVESPAGESGRRSIVGFDELDVLPDLDGFSDSFTASEFSSGGSPAERSESRGPQASPGGVSSVPRTAQGNLDSVALAQAVRTILKRDQKG